MNANKTPEADNHPRSIDVSSGGQVNADLAAESAPGDRFAGEDLDARQEQLIDEAVEETVPASDPIAVKRIT